MAEIISMPQLSDTMEEGTVIKWNKKVGDTVSEGDILAEIETDKAIQDFEVDVSGILLFIGVKEGERTRVNDILAIVGKKGEDINNIILKSSSEKTEKKDTDTQKIEKNNNKEEKNEYCDDKKNEKRKFISPLAKKMAKSSGISLKNIKIGSGEYGRIIKKDIELQKNKQFYENRITHTSMRKKIAAHLTFSKFSAPHYYLFSEILVDNLVDIRKNINNKISLEEKISFNDFIIKAAAQSLKKNTNMNISWNEEEILIHKSINIGFAVAIKDGLIVPVIKNADQKSILQISKEVKNKILHSKSRIIKKEELENSTFTISNLGMYGIDCFTSIINIPNSSILSIGSITKRPIIKNSKIEIGYTMKITLSCDHRIIDGATGSNYIHTLKGFLEDPITILI
ncbi:dihydrolipoamide acetyltransferase family protein [Blattabacterium cuenoti]|uniref:dihydrolipoamide acetyltransferase family protein n=1 Tax=Blattabacterium cuenoti TaxID=1653831 RepID=UPI00163D23DD|nr:dihydrolipoamide acetyltransferase family protein [Blattabacterium cuenoti]